MSQLDEMREIKGIILHVLTGGIVDAECMHSALFEPSMRSAADPGGHIPAQAQAPAFRQKRTHSGLTGLGSTARAGCPAPPCPTPPQSGCGLGAGGGRALEGA